MPRISQILAVGCNTSNNLVFFTVSELYRVDFFGGTYLGLYGTAQMQRRTLASKSIASA